MVSWDKGIKAEMGSSEELQTNKRKLLGVMNMFTILLVMDSQVAIHVRAQEMAFFKDVQLFYFNYTLIQNIKLELKSCPSPKDKQD